jgi:hypothetical protein
MVDSAVRAADFYPQTVTSGRVRALTLDVSQAAEGCP